MTFSFVRMLWKLVLDDSAIKVCLQYLRFQMIQRAKRILKNQMGIYSVIRRRKLLILKMLSQKAKITKKHCRY